MAHSQSVDTKSIDINRRKVLLRATSTISAVGIGFAAYPFLASWQVNARAIALGSPIEVDISTIEEGQLIITQWRGKPTWILKRSQAMLNSLKALEKDNVLRDINSAESIQPKYTVNRSRSIYPEIWVAIGICTHLGCSPNYVPVEKSAELNFKWRGGFFCPCHGSKYDLAGRVYKSVPAPTNLTIPPYHFKDASTIVVVGVDQV